MLANECTWVEKVITEDYTIADRTDTLIKTTQSWLGEA